MLNAGNGQTLSVTFNPTDTATYQSATASVLLNVLAAAPTVTWNAPAPIVAGVALSATQLNATADVPRHVRLFARGRHRARRSGSGRCR